MTQNSECNHNYDYNFIIKDTNQEPNGEMHKASLGGNAGLCPLLMESVCITFLAHQCLYQTGKVPWASVPRVFIGILSHRHDWVTGHVVELNLQYPCPVEVERSGWYVAQSPNLLITWLVFLAWPVPILKSETMGHLIGIKKGTPVT